MIRLRELIKEFELRKGGWEGFTDEGVFDYLPTNFHEKFEKVYSTTAAKLWRRDANNKDYTKESLSTDDQKKLVDKYIQDYTSILTSTKKIGGKKYIGLYESGTVTIFLLFDFEPVYSNPFEFFHPRSEGGETSTIIGWIGGSKGKREFGITPSVVFNTDNAVRIHGSWVSKKYRGSGYGKLLYDTMMNHVDVLVSDEILYEGSFGLWTKYIHGRSKLFAVMYKTAKYPITIPIQKKTQLLPQILTARSGYLEKSPIGFVVFTKKVPSELIKIASKLKSIDISSLNIVSFTLSKFTDKMQSTLDESTSIDDFIKEISGWEYFSKGSLHFKEIQSANVLFCFADALVFVKEVGDSLEWDLL